AELIRALKAAAERHGRKAFVYFVSASPPQIGAAIRKKLALDGVPYDGIVFKDQLAHLKRGKLRNLREHVGFKLAELLRGRLAAPTFNYFQTAAVLGADGYLEAEDVARVGRVLLEGAGYTARALENSLGDLVRRGVLKPAAADTLGARLRAAGVLPPGDEK